MPRSSKLERIVTNALANRITQTESDIATLVTTSVTTGDNVSELANDAQYQTLSQVQAALDNLIDSAPGTLDTLGEIAAALNDDDNAIASLVAQDTAHSNAIASLQSALADTDNDTYIDFEVGTTDNDQIQLYAGGTKVSTIGTAGLKINNLPGISADPLDYGAGRISFGDDARPYIDGINGEENRIHLGFDGTPKLTVADTGVYLYIQTPYGAEVGFDTIGNKLWTNYALYAQEGARNEVSCRLIRIKSTESTYDNTLSSLDATNAQQAIDLLDLRGRITRRTITADITLSASDTSRQHIINQSGASRNVGLPPNPQPSQEYEVINSVSSTHNLVVDSVTILPSDRYAVQWDGVEWVEM